MASSPLRSLILVLARLALIGPVGRFIVERFILDRRDLNVTPASPNTGKEGLLVIACGFPRSGTRSLMVALERLGFKCYHGANLLYDDWSYVGKSGHCKLWLQAAAAARHDNWQKILQGYSAIVDAPATLFYKQLMAAYPNAKVILNVRDPDQWHRSCMESIFEWHHKLCFRVFRSDNFIKLSDLFWLGMFKGKFEDKEFAVNVYKNHVEEVTRIVPKEKLLVYEVQDGWASLCSFLQVDIPDTPFPRTNDTADFRGRVKKQERAYAVFSAVYVGFLSCALVLLHKWVCQI